MSLPLHPLQMQGPRLGLSTPCYPPSSPSAPPPRSFKFGGAPHHLFPGSASSSGPRAATWTSTDHAGSRPDAHARNTEEHAAPPVPASTHLRTPAPGTRSDVPTWALPPTISHLVTPPLQPATDCPATDHRPAGACQAGQRVPCPQPGSGRAREVRQSPALAWLMFLLLDIKNITAAQRRDGPSLFLFPRVKAQGVGLERVAKSQGLLYNVHRPLLSRSISKDTTLGFLAPEIHSRDQQFL